MAKVVNEAASACGSYGYTYDGVLGGSCTTTTSLPTYLSLSLSRPSTGLIL